MHVYMIRLFTQVNKQSLNTDVIRNILDLVIHVLHTHD